jgi:hypothetical protein
LFVFPAADDVDHNAVGAAISTITSNLPEMTRGVKMIAALMDDQEKGEHLFDATRRLCAAFSDLLRAAEPESHEVIISHNFSLPPFSLDSFLFFSGFK